MNIDLSLLTKEQQKRLLAMHNSFLESNRKQAEARASLRSAAKISPPSLQALLFEQREEDGDVYMDLDNSIYGSYASYDEDTRQIVADGEEVGAFEAKHFIPSCDHLRESLLDELNDQVAYCTGGNYSRWSDIKEEAKKRDNSLLGYRQLENGLSFYGMYGTNDDYWPVFFILYFDGEKLRGYIPKEGNEYCESKQEAWSSDCFKSDSEYEIFQNEMMKKANSGAYFDYDKIKEDILRSIRVS